MQQIVARHERAAGEAARRARGARRATQAGRRRAGESRSMFMDFYAAGARAHMKRYGTTKEQFARIAVKNHRNGSLNPHAQYQEVYTLEDILSSPMVAEPLTRLMCSPIGDGAAATILCASSIAPRFSAQAGQGAGLRACPREPITTADEPGVVTRAAQAGLREGRRRSRGPECHRVARRLRAGRADDLRGAGTVQAGRGRQADRRGRHRDQRPHPGEHLRRPAREGPSGGSDGRGADLRDLLAACAARPASARSPIRRSASPRTAAAWCATKRPDA